MIIFIGIPLATAEPGSCPVSGTILFSLGGGRGKSILITPSFGQPPLAAEPLGVVVFVVAVFVVAVFAVAVFVVAVFVVGVFVVCKKSQLGVILALISSRLFFNRSSVGDISTAILAHSKDL